MEETARQVIDDLISRGALSGAASLILLVALLGGWWLWTDRITRRRRSARVVILVTGTRGKSSTVRLLHAALVDGGFLPYGKVTGTEAVEISTDGTELETHRLGAPSLLEMFGSMRRAFRAQPTADSLVFECMAVSPELIELLSESIVDPGVVLITNVQLDHLEEEGTTPAEIADSLANAIRPRSLVVTGESDPGALGVLEKRATEAGAELVVRPPTDVPPEISARIPFAHPQNVGLVLEVTRSLGIDDETAIEGMRKATREPGEQEVWRRTVDGLEITWADLGAVNDPDSLGQALDALGWEGDGIPPRIAITFGRWDRPLRALEFAGFLDPDNFDAVIVAGGPVHPVRKALIAAGWPPERVVVSPRFSSLEAVWTGELNSLLDRIDPDASEAYLVSLQNEHDGLADRMREFFLSGSQLDGNLEEEVTGSGT